jgi:hypothetical protein
LLNQFRMCPCWHGQAADWSIAKKDMFAESKNAGLRFSYVPTHSTATVTCVPPRALSARSRPEPPIAATRAAAR